MPGETSKLLQRQRVRRNFSSIELCAGAGGQALGLESAGFSHVALVEIDKWSRETLLLNRPYWPVIDDGSAQTGDVTTFSGSEYCGVDLLAGGVPCPPFSIAGRQLGNLDDRDLFPHALRIVNESEPRAVMLENVRGLLSAKFDEYRRDITEQLHMLGYVGEWKLLNASDFGVPQLRPRAVLVAFRKDVVASLSTRFNWPSRTYAAPTVGEALLPEMSSLNWERAFAWAETANSIAPTLVGGSRKHGGPDLGPTRARQAWATLGVDGRGLADNPPSPGFEGDPRLTLKMTATLQGFPEDWLFAGRKTAAYRQIGNAFPPPVAEAIGLEIARVLEFHDASLNGAATQRSRPAPVYPSFQMKLRAY